MKRLSLLLIIAILSQGCVVYQKTSVPLEKAAYTGRAKLINTNGKPLYFDNIEKEDSVYYGIKLRTMATAYEKLRLSPASVESVYLYDKKKSILLSWLTPVLVLSGLFGILVLALVLTYGPL